MAAEKVSTAIIENSEISDQIFSMWISAPDIAAEAKAGQFVSLYCKDGSSLLPRPISICEIDQAQGRIRLVYRVAGKGTKEFSQLISGETIDVMGPLGNGFTAEGKKVILIGGGIGIPPMLELAKRLNSKGTLNKVTKQDSLAEHNDATEQVIEIQLNSETQQNSETKQNSEAKQNCEIQIVLGYRDTTFLAEEFEAYGKVYIATEDGSMGTKGNVLDAIRENALEADMIFACGPTPMLRGMKDYAMKQGIRAQLSLEERMACGIGACLGCVCKTKEIDHHSNVHNKRICKDGPVFYAEEVEL